MEIKKVKGTKGYFEYNYLIYEKPHFIELDQDKNHPDTENPHLETPNVETPTQINTNIINTNNKDDKIDKKILGEHLKEIRTKNSNTQAKVAKIINIDQSNYSKYELGKLFIHTYALIEFAKHYKVSIDWLCVKTKDLEIK